jgi:hypothetical protein
MALMEAMGKFGEEASKAGVLLESGGLLPSATGVRLRVSKGKLSVTDGPFTEAKEIVGGYAMYEVPTKADALEWTRRFMQLHLEHWPGWEGESELRQVFGPGDMPG